MESTSQNHQARRLLILEELEERVMLNGGPVNWSAVVTEASGPLTFTDADVRHDLVLGVLLGSVHVGDDLRADLILGNGLYGSVDIGDDSTGEIDINGHVYGDITVGGNLAYLESLSDPVPAGGPIDYRFYVGGWPQGTLTVGGSIGAVVQA